MLGARVKFARCGFFGLFAVIFGILLIDLYYLIN